MYCVGGMRLDSTGNDEIGGLKCNIRHEMGSESLLDTCASVTF